MNDQKPSQYQNNPFLIGLDGLKLFFGLARSVATAAVVLAALAFVANIVQALLDDDRAATQTAPAALPSLDAGTIALVSLTVGTVLFLVIFLNVMILAVTNYTAARTARGESVELKQALGVAFQHFFSYLWMLIIMMVKIILWSLLFIVPGIIMSIRYSLAGVAFFDEDKRGNAAIKRSLALTKNAFWTTLGANLVWNAMTLGLIAQVLQPGTNAVLYRQLKRTTDANETKPAPHFLSWLIPALLGGFWLLFLLLILLIVASPA